MQADHEFRRRNPEAAEILSNPGSYSFEEIEAARKIRDVVDKKYDVLRDKTEVKHYAMENDLFYQDGSWHRREASYYAEDDTIGINLAGSDGNIIDGKQYSRLRAHEAAESKYDDHDRANQFGDYAANNYNWANWLTGIGGSNGETVSNSDWLYVNSGSIGLGNNNSYYRWIDGTKTKNTSISVDTELLFRPWMGEKEYLPMSAQAWTSTGSGFLRTISLGLVDIDTGGVGQYLR